jgi:hypothetical protein
MLSSVSEPLPEIRARPAASQFDVHDAPPPVATVNEAAPTKIGGSGPSGLDPVAQPIGDVTLILDLAIIHGGTGVRRSTLCMTLNSLAHRAKAPRMGR